MTVKPSENEEQYFKDHELKRRLERAAQERHCMAEAEKKRLKDLHHMHCPKCGHKLVIENYGKVEVDVCPGCKGLWLDVNELEIIVEQTGKTKPFSSFLRILGSK